ncbi:MAG TPA: hypothetical protein VF762_23465 [Blastocatellia bacterium]|jgi:hypothetical protein
MVSESQIRSAIIAVISANDGKARAHRRWRYPAQNRLAEWVNLFRDEDQKINAYMVRRVRRFPTLRGIPGRLVKVEYVYEVRFYLGLFDSEDDSAASEEIAQARVDSLAASFEADVTLGLGRCVSHGGLELPTDFEDVLVGDWAAHRAVLRISVEVANVECQE